jgi:hypothetical protein
MGKGLFIMQDMAKGAGIIMMHSGVSGVGE